MLHQSSAQRLISAFILSRIDCCNAVFAGLLATTLVPLMHVLDAAARFVNSTNEIPTSEMMRSLHWLLIAYRIWFTLCVLMHGIVNGRSPAYLSDSTTRTSSLPGRSRLRSAGTNQVDVPRTRTKFGERAFVVAGPREWTLFPTTFETSVNFQHLNVPLRPITLKWHMVTKCVVDSYIVRRLWTNVEGYKRRHLNRWTILYIAYTDFTCTIHLWLHFNALYK